MTSYDYTLVVALSVLCFLAVTVVAVGAGNLGSVEMERWSIVYGIITFGAFSVNITILTLAKHGVYEGIEVEAPSVSEFIYSLILCFSSIVVGVVIGNMVIEKSSLWSWGVYGTAPILGMKLSEPEYVRLLKLTLNLVVGYSESGLFHAGLPLIAGDENKYLSAVFSNICFGVLHFYVYGSIEATIVAFTAGLSLTFTLLYLSEKGYPAQHSACLAHALWNIMVLL